MPTFTIHARGQSERRESLDLPILKIGRDERSHLRVEDIEVARMHAVIEVGDDGTLTLIDLGSSGGTFVNEQRINKASLRAGDRIRLGRSTIVVGEPNAKRDLLLPKPEIVRARFGDAFTPSDVFGVAALVLGVDGIRREAWSDQIEVAERLFETYPRGAPPAVELSEISGPLSRNFKTIDDSEPTRVTRCSSCIIRPGFAPCNLCLGTGAGSKTEGVDRCVACNGEGFLPCAACDGTTRVVSCTIRYVNDVYIRVRRAIVPAVHKTIRPFLETSIAADAAWPREHAFDPEPSMVASAYRGASAVRAPEEFHGFFFGDAIAECLAARAEATTGLARFESSIFAVPILWTVTGEKHDAYFFDAAGVLQHVG